MRGLPVFVTFFVLIFGFVSAVPVVLAESLLAFPGAQGFGSMTPGGRGGQVLSVIHTKDTTDKNSPDYPGSLRAAVEASGPRIVIFKTGGYITTNRPIVIKNPFITIAAQTAPGDGIVIRNSPLIIATHDVIVRGLRVRVGDDPAGYGSGSRDGINISSTFSGQDIYNVIVDHSSVSWGLDENWSTWTDKVRDVTIQWSISSEALDDSIHVDEGQPAGVYDRHSMGVLIGSSGVRRISLHHNLLAHDHWRTPALGGTVEFINNVVYNWGGGSYPANFSSTNLTYSNFINNYYLRGTNSTSISRIGVLLDPILGTGSRIYVKGNLFYNQNNTLFGQDLILGNPTFRSSTLISNTSLPAPSFTIQSAPEAYTAVMALVGAITPTRDSVDEYIINSVENRTGTIIDCIVTCNEVSDRRNFHGGWPSYSSGTPPTDSDADGMPDAWERERGLNSTLNDSASDRDHDDYTNVEEYINSLVPSVAGQINATRTPTPSRTRTPTRTPTKTPTRTLTPSKSPTLPPGVTATNTPILTPTTTPGPLPADINDDGKVDALDYVLLFQSFGKQSNQDGYNPRADITGDGEINALDYVILFENFVN